MNLVNILAEFRGIAIVIIISYGLYFALSAQNAQGPIRGAPKTSCRLLVSISESHVKSNDSGNSIDRRNGKYDFAIFESEENEKDEHMLSHNRHYWNYCNPFSYSV